MEGLREMFGVNRFIVSLCNPHILPVVALKRAVGRRVGRLVEMEFKHRCSQVSAWCACTLSGSLLRAAALAGAVLFCSAWRFLACS